MYLLLSIGDTMEVYVFITQIKNKSKNGPFTTKPGIHTYILGAMLAICQQLSQPVYKSRGLSTGCQHHIPSSGLIYSQTTFVLHSPPFFDQLSRLDGHYLTNRLRALQTPRRETTLTKTLYSP